MTRPPTPRAVLAVAALIALGAALGAAPGRAGHFSWDQNHDGFKPDASGPPDPTPPRCNPSASPFEASTGAFFYYFEDFSARSVGLDLSFARSYQSSDERNGPLGRGWTHSYDLRLMDVTDGVTISALCRKGDGKRHRFVRQGDGSYLPPSDFPAELTAVAGGFTLREPDATTKHFDTRGLLTKIEDHNGNAVTLTYDASGFLTAVTAANGESLTLVKGPNGKIDSVTDPASRTFDFDYDAEGNLIRVTNPLSEETDFFYTAASLLEEITDPLGRTAQSVAYDGEGRVTGYIENGAAWTVSYDAASNQVTKTDAGGNDWTVRYNEHGNVIERTDPLGNRRSFTYDSLHRLVAQTDPEGTIGYEYDSRGRLTRIVNAENEEAALGFTAGVDDPDTWTDTSGGQTSYQYDAAGNLTAATDSLGNGESFVYDALGRVEKSVDANGSETLFDYDARGNLAKVTQADASEIHLVYDAVGNLESLQDPDGFTVSFAYDALNRITSTTVGGHPARSYGYAPTCAVCGGDTRLGSVTTPDGTRSWAYDAFGRVTAATDALDVASTAAYEPRGYLDTVTLPGPAVTSYTYDIAGRLTAIHRPAGSTSMQRDSVGRATRLEDAIGATFESVRDATGRITQVTSTDTGVTNYSFDADGLVTSRSDGRGVLAAYSFDPRARLGSIAYPDPTRNTVATYDSAAADFGKGRLTHLAHDGSEIVLHKNNLGYHTKRELERNGTTYVTEWGFTAAGRPATILYPSGVTVAYGLDGQGLVDSVSVDWAGSPVPVASSISRDGLGRVTGLTFGNGLVESRGYDAKGRLDALSVAGLYDRAYTYDDRDNLLTMSDALDGGAAQVYTYDLQDRLLTASGPWGALSFTLDGNGNRLSRTLGAATATYSYTGNRLTQISGATTAAYFYDGAGNTTAAGDLDLEHGDDGRLLRVLDGGSELARYAYNGLGQRIEKTTPAGTVLYHYDRSGRLLEETDVAGNAIASYVYLDWRPLAVVRGGAIHYYQVDPREVPLRLTDAAAATVWSAEWQPFGEPFAESGTVAQPLRFPGHYFDAESGLSYNWYRYYEPSTGRYLQPEPLGPQGTFEKWLREGGDPQPLSMDRDLALYVYAGANPHKYLDPNGLEKRRYYPPWNPFGPAQCVNDAVQAGRKGGAPKHHGGGGKGYRWAHCYTSCRIANQCGAGPWITQQFGKAKEWRDLYKCFQEPPTGPHCYSAMQPDDYKDNDHGIACPQDVPCDEWCEPLVGKPDSPGPWYNTPIHPNQPWP